MARICSGGDPRFQPYCHVGYAKNLVDLGARTADGMAYCRVVTDPAAKSACYTAMGEEAWVLSEDVQRRRAWCTEAEPGFVAVCLRGAGLTE